jgi:hypothetical protein
MATVIWKVPRSRIIEVGQRRISFEPMTPLELLAEEWRRLQLQLKSAGRSPRKQRRVVQGYQGSRVQIKLAQIFPDGIPSVEELSNPELVGMVVNEFKKDPKKTGLAIPDRKTILREAGRIPRKK